MAGKGKQKDKSREAPATKKNYKSEVVDPDLGGSWVVNEDDDEHDDDDEAYSEGESDLESVTEAGVAEPETPSVPTTGRRTSTRVHTGTAESAIFPGQNLRNSELRMPTIDHNSSAGQLRQRKTASPPLSRSVVWQKQAKQERRAHAQEATTGFAEHCLAYCKQIMLYLVDILGIALHYIKGPIGFILAIYLLVGLMTIAGNLFTQSISTALSPICRIPGASLLNIPFCDRTSTAKYGSEPPPPEFDRLMESQSRFEDILSGSTVGVTLPADMKRSEAAIRDLRTLVRYSSLKSRNELALEFDGFIETARMASADLQKFNSHTGRAADTIISTARWTMRTLDDVQERDSQRGAVAAFLSDTVLAPFQPAKLTPALVLDQYVAHTRKVEDEINRLLGEAQALLLILQNLEERLDVIHDISVRDGQIAHIAKEELLGQLWTFLGGNKSELRKYSSQLKLLQEVGRYRASAWAHVSATVLKLQAMNAELEELRERVGATELLQDRKDVPLNVHLEAIQMGVERLEVGRKGMREAEMEYYNRAIQGASGEQREAPVKGRLIDS